MYVSSLIYRVTYVEMCSETVTAVTDLVYVSLSDIQGDY